MAEAPASTHRSVRRGPPRRTLVLVWLGAVGFFGVLLGVARAAEEPLDDPDLAFQRPGFLDVGDLPEPAPDIDDVRFTSRRTVVFFARPGWINELCRALAADPFAADVQSVIVVPDASAEECAEVPVVVSSGLADRFGMREPRGGGAPVGYAVVDAAGMIRYRTLDPAVTSLIDEIGTILGALS
jgi:hypothetical protein